MAAPVSAIGEKGLLWGEVWASNDHPPGARVVIRRADDPFGPEWAVDAEADGSFRFEWQVGEWRLHAEAPSFFPDSVIEVHLEPGWEVQSIQLLVSQDQCEAWGYVTDIDGRPVPGAVVMSERMTLRAETDLSGLYRLHTEFISSDLVVSAKGFAPARVEYEWSYESPVRVDIRLSRACRLSGTVRDSQGAPLAGAEVGVRWLGEGDDQYARPPHARTDSSGHYALDGLAPGENGVDVSAVGFADEWERAQLPREDDVDFTLLRVGRVKGVMGGVRARQGPPSLRLRPIPGWPWSGPLEDVVWGADGAFELRSVKPGRYVLLASQEGCAPACSQEFEVREQAAVEDVSLQLSEGGTLDGVVRAEPSGLPLPGAWIVDVTNKTRWKEDPFALPAQASTTSDENGVFHLTLLPAGTREILVSHPSHPSRTVLVDLTEGRAVTRDICLPQGCTIRGRLILAHGRPVGTVGTVVQAMQGLPGTEMRCMRIFPGGGRPEIELKAYGLRVKTEVREGNRMDADGRYDLRGLEPGPCIVCADVRDTEDSTYRRSVVIDLQCGRDAEWDIVWMGSNRVVGTLSEGGRPVAEGWFHLHGRGASAGTSIQLRTDKDGAFAETPQVVDVAPRPGAQGSAGDAPAARRQSVPTRTPRASVGSVRSRSR